MSLQRLMDGAPGLYLTADGGKDRVLLEAEPYSLDAASGAGEGLNKRAALPRTTPTWSGSRNGR